MPTLAEYQLATPRCQYRIPGTGMNATGSRQCCTVLKYIVAANKWRCPACTKLYDGGTIVAARRDNWIGMAA